ncbi:phosphoribosylglycinamide formyltransferase [Roseivirga sp.]|uniref:phosphoribosylglycinamide formyltransferase n=1 Tax=Roseivirga sp. TaxID=1964215 RepID=UPI003B8D3755
MTKKRISIFASGGGSNAERFFEFFQNDQDIEIVSLFTNNKSAGVIERAKRFNIPYHIYNRNYWQNGEVIIDLLKSQKVDYIVLAGFMLLIPDELVSAYPDKIFNIHPALLPKFGGKGMYGMNVHKAVKEAREATSGITIHYVNEHYDEGQIISQVSCPIELSDTVEEIAKKVLALEHKNYPKVIAEVVRKSI